MARLGLEVKVSSEPLHANRRQSQLSRDPSLSPTPNLRGPLRSTSDFDHRSQSPLVISPVSSPSSPPPAPRRPIPPPKDQVYRSQSAAQRPFRSRSPLAKQEAYLSTGSEGFSSLPPGASSGFDYRRSQIDVPLRNQTQVSATNVLFECWWRPWWLRRRVLASFTVVFALLAAAAEPVKRFAVGEASMPVRGVWQFGPVIIVSVLSALWSRVDFQTQRYMPWMILSSTSQSSFDSRTALAERTVLLDYASLAYPQRLLKALQNRHFVVACSMLVSGILQLQIFLSTGLFRLDISPNGMHLLRATPGNTHTMTALFGLMLLVSLPVVFLAPSKRGIAPRDPTTLGGTATLLSNSKQVLSKLRGSGTRGISGLAPVVAGTWSGTIVERHGAVPEYRYEISRISASDEHGAEYGTTAREGEAESYKPWQTHPWPAYIIIIISAALIAAIWVLYNVKGDDNHFKPLAGGHFLWTSLITLIFVFLSLFLGSIDSGMRRLAPFSNLVEKECTFKESLGLDYTNEFGITTIVKSIFRADWKIFIVKLLAMLGWLMPIFTAGLIQPVGVSQHGHVDLQHTSYFDSSSLSEPSKPNPQLVHEIFLNDVPSYPPWTYQELAFPILTTSGQHSNTSSAWERSIMATVPAVFAGLSCTAHTFAQGSGRDMGCKPIQEGFRGKDECSDSPPSIGFVASSCSALPSNGSFNFIWGTCSRNGTMHALMCDETVKQQNVQTTFVNGNFTISTDTIPIPNLDTTIATNISLTSEGAYGLLKGIGSDDSKRTGLDDFFTTLVQSSHGVPPDRLTSVDRTNSVQHAIELLHSIIRAQFLNSDSIRQNYAPNAPLPDPLPATYEYVDEQLAQSAPQTYALTILLGLAVLLSVISLLLLFSRRHPHAILPKNPGSIVAQASLLADSTLWWHLPRGAEWMSDERLAHRLRRKTFRLGWFDGAGVSRETLGRNYTVGMIQDEGRLDTCVIELEGDAGNPFSEKHAAVVCD